jgi:hypothetical protein
MSKQAVDLGTSRPSDAGQRGPKRLLDDKDFWKIYEKGETIGRGHFAKVKLVRHRSRRDRGPLRKPRPAALATRARVQPSRPRATPEQAVPCDPRDPWPASCASRIAEPSY